MSKTSENPDPRRPDPSQPGPHQSGQYQPGQYQPGQYQANRPDQPGPYQADLPDQPGTPYQPGPPRKAGPQDRTDPPYQPGSYPQGGVMPAATGTPAPSAGRALVAAGGALLGSAVIGLLGGLIWSVVAPKAVYVVVSRGSADVVNAETTAFIADDAWFCLIAVIGGLLIGAAVYRLAIRRYGPAPMAGVLLGSVVAGLLARFVGQNLGLAKFNAELASSHQGALLHAPPVLGADSATILWPAIAFWPLAACLIPAALVLLAALRDRPGVNRAQQQ